MTRFLFISLGICLCLSLHAQSSAKNKRKKTGENIEQSVKLGETFRDYIIHLPAGYSPKKKFPMVLNLHGLGGNMRQHMEYTGLNAVADKERFIVVYPQGLVANVPGMGERSQWDAYFFTQTNDVAFIDTLIDMMQQEFAVDPSRIYATGFSNGAFMSYRLACELPGKIAAIAPVAGNMPILQQSEWKQKRSVPILQIHGTADKLVPPAGIPMYSLSTDSTLQFFVALNKCSEKKREFDLPDADPEDGSTVQIFTYADCDGKATVEHYRIENGGHTWPGSQEVKRLGVTNRDFEANRVIWEFFARHALDN